MTRTKYEQGNNPAFTFPPALSICSLIPFMNWSVRAIMQTNKPSLAKRRATEAPMLYNLVKGDTFFKGRTEQRMSDS